jgi:hypothetical protein
VYGAGTGGGGGAGISGAAVGAAGVPAPGLIVIVYTPVPPAKGFNMPMMGV